MPDATFGSCSVALIIAWGVQTLVLLSGRVIARFLGPKALDAMESLTGLLLAAVAVSMMIHGINGVYGLPRL